MRAPEHSVKNLAVGVLAPEIVQGLVELAISSSVKKLVWNYWVRVYSCDCRGASRKIKSAKLQVSIRNNKMNINPVVNEGKGQQPAASSLSVNYDSPKDHQSLSPAIIK